MTFETFRAASAGKQHIVGQWRIGAEGRSGELRGLAKRAVLSVEGFEISRSNINADVRLSDSARKEDIRTAAEGRLREIGQAVQSLQMKRAEIQADASRLTAIKPYNGDAAQVAIDLALAQHLRGMDAAERTAALFAGTDPDLVAAVLRLPTALTGVKEDIRARVLKDAISRRYPREAQEHEDLAIGLADAAEALNRAFDLISREAGIGLTERALAAGSREAAHDLISGVSPVAVDHIMNRIQSN
jgi:hypothetical protein